MGIFQNKDDPSKTIEEDEKAIHLDDENVPALMSVAREYAFQKKNLDRAVEYAQKAVDTAVKMKDRPPAASFTPDQWKKYVEGMETNARGILAYVTSLKRLQG